MKAVFEEATRCPECTSDQIYVFQEVEGGMCMKCKAMVSGIIKGGISYEEYARQMRLANPSTFRLDTDDVLLNEKDKKEAASEKSKEDVAKLKEDMAKLNKSAIMPLPGAMIPILPPLPPDPKKPEVEEASIFEKAKAWLFSKKDEKKEEKKSEAEKPKAPPPAPRPPSAKPEPPSAKKETGLPMPGETWAIGPCTMCSLSERKTGHVRQSKASGTCTRFLILDTGYFGCFFCARKV